MLVETGGSSWAPQEGGAGPESPAPLLDGLVGFVSLSREGTTCEAVVQRREVAAPRLTRRERRILAMLVGGHCQKHISHELGLAVSTVSAHVCMGLRKLGFARWEHAVVVSLLVERGLESSPSGDTAASVLVTVLEADLAATLAPLSEAEREVTLLILDGRSNAEIAGIRGRSERTVANQLASAFRKHRVGGRLELIRSLLWTSPAAPSIRRSSPPLSPSWVPPGPGYHSSPDARGQRP